MAILERYNSITFGSVENIVECNTMEDIDNIYAVAITALRATLDGVEIIKDGGIITEVYNKRHEFLGKQDG